jgi:sigma-B regulation protein RsbU (phosphoserine phosphatase)
VDSLRGGWKFPAVATLIVGVVMQLYESTKDRLERRNVALERAIESETAQREVQEQELARAREIQMNLLPKEIPQVAGFEIAGTWEPARTVGGDYFDVIRLSDSKVAICIADVVGKSVSAALLMANVQATVRAFASESSTPSWLCGRVNSVLCSNIAIGKFVTLFYGILDAAAGTLRYTNAGHLAPILVSASGQVQQLSSNGALLGVFPQWKFEEATLEMTPGDRLVLFTDGITEAMKPDGEEFGEERLVSLTRDLAEQSPLSLQCRLLSDVKKFCDSQLHDDATLVVVGAMVRHGAVAGRA